MKTAIPAFGTIFWTRRLVLVIIALALPLAFGFAQPGLAQTTEPLKFSNNFFVTGDYVVAGWLKTSSDGSFSSGTIKIPDKQAYASTEPDQRVPVGADVVAAFLYWSSVETANSNAGRNGFFGASPVTSPMTGEPLGNPNAPVSWSSGGCVGSANGSKTMQVYRANVSAYLPVDAKGIVQPNTTYQVRLADNKNATVLGATLVIVYRILSQDVPLKAVVFYDGAYAPSNAALTTTQKLKGFFQPGDQSTSITKFTAIVANGQSNKNEQIYLNNYDSPGHSTLLPSLYGTKPPFPGTYNGLWDNPTWFPNAYSTTPVGNIAVQSSDSSETVVVVPSSSNKGCVSWGAAILSTTVQHSGDGILDIWKVNPNYPKPGYCDPRANHGLTTQGTCTVGDANWVDLPGALPNQNDVFVQLDYMCSANADGTACETGPGAVSYFPNQAAIDNVVSAFSDNGSVKVHIDPVHHAIPAQTCTDDTAATPPQYCPFPTSPGQDGSGVVGWKAGFAALKSQPLNLNADGTTWTEAQCVASLSTCKRRFQPGRNNSYHEVIFGRASSAPNWTLADGTLASASISGTTVTFNTASAHGLIAATSTSDTTPNARVTIADAVSNPSLNGTYLVQSVAPPNSPTSFTIQIANATTVPAPTRNTDPFLSITSGVVGTGSGVSDVGGADSLISLGTWGADGQVVPASSGTLMHEVGHSIGLTHGGLYSSPVAGGYMNGIYAVPDGGYSFVFEANCKSNFRTVMNYLFQVDLLDGQLDYSEDVLPILHENVATAAGVLSGPSTTKWYSPVQPLVGSAATSHCDGTPLSPLTDPNPTMYRLEGPNSTLSWAKNQDLNFDGTTESALRGFDDWSNIDLRQVGATGNDFWSGGSSRVGGGSSRVGGGSSRVGGGSSRVGGGVGEIDFRASNSVVRKPSGLIATLASQNSVLLQWTPPTFAQSLITGFNVYRSKNGGPFTQLPPTPTKSIAGMPLPLPTTLSFTDTTASCTSGNYTYFVTTFITDTGASGTNGATRESLASNLATCGR